MHLQFGNLLNEDFIVLKEKCSNEMKKLINNRKERMDEVCPKIRKEVLGIECS